MATTDSNSVIVELYDLTLTERKDDRFGRVVTTKSLNEDDLIKIAVSRRTDLSEETMRASLNLINKVAIEQIANGASVKTGLAYLNLGVSGVFIGDNAQWNSSEHSLWVKATPTAALREAVASCRVDVRGMAVVGIAINTLVDVSSGESNSKLTPGGGVNITGCKLKIDGDDPKVGLSLINVANGEAITIAKNAILLNEPSRISFIVPANLAKGDYKLSLCTQYSASVKSLKEARSIVYDYVLTVS